MFRFRSACHRVISLMAALLALPLLSHAAAGDLYVGNQGSHNIERFSPDGTSTLLADSVSGVDAPTGLCFDLAGNLFVADTARNAVLKITPGGVLSVFATTRVSNPTGLAFDHSGNLYVVNYGNNSIEKFTSGGVGSTFATIGLNRPFAIAIDVADNVFVTSGNAGINKYTPQGVASLFGDSNSGLSYPEGLAFDQVGNLYAANNANNTIVRFTQNGVSALFASGGNLNGPVGLARLWPFLTLSDAPE